MHEFVELGVQVGSRFEPVRLSWTTASRLGMVAYHRYERSRPANCGQPLQKVMTGCQSLFVIGRSIIVIRQGMRW